MYEVSQWRSTTAMQAGFRDCGTKSKSTRVRKLVGSRSYYEQTSIKDGTQKIMSHFIATICSKKFSGVGITGGDVGLKAATVMPETTCGKLETMQHS